MYLELDIRRENLYFLLEALLL